MTRRNLLVFLCIFMLSLASCQRPTPPVVVTYKTTGAVTYTDGTPVAKAIVQFASEANPGLNMSATTNEDGTFELKTLHENDNLDGAIAGPCSVMVTLPITGPIPTTLNLKKKYEITEGDNHFDIKLDVKQ